MSQKIQKYIIDNWEKTIRKPGTPVHGIVNMPCSYTTPCADEGFVDFFYWDTYFANIGLYHAGRIEQAEKNLDIMKFFIEAIGYVPNANHILDRSQPPLFTRGVYDLYRETGDTRVIEKYASGIKKEQQFFEYDRMTEIGLNAYGTNATRTELLKGVGKLSKRVGINVPEDMEQRIRQGYNLYAIAESGWDFNPRFQTENGRFETDEFVPVELNCLLYDAEKKAAELFSIIGRKEEAQEFENKAVKRKKLMERYLKNQEDGIFRDYNFKRNCFSSVISCASFYVYTVGITKERVPAEKLLECLELPFGLSACEERPGDAYLQWDYPAMWPSNVYFAVHGLWNTGMHTEAKRIAQKYVDTVDRCFEKTGQLWEKYDASSGEVSVTREYTTPPMMGWTAGVYADMCAVLEMSTDEKNSRCFMK